MNGARRVWGICRTHDMRLISAALAALTLLPAAPAVAEKAAQSPERQNTPQESPERPVTDDTVTAGDVAKTPLTDLNLSRDEIPDLLIRARADPYDLSGLNRCADIVGAVQQLDAVLGEDLDTAEARNRGVDAGRVAQWAVGSFIPFRGLIREVSGARAHERRVRDAVIGGMMRRAFLKGLGQQKGCRYPGRPARADEVEQIKAGMDAADRAAVERKAIEKRTRKAERDRKEDDGPQFVSQPVVQPLK